MKRSDLFFRVVRTVARVYVTVVLIQFSHVLLTGEPLPNLPWLDIGYSI